MVCTRAVLYAAREKSATDRNVSILHISFTLVRLLHQAVKTQISQRPSQRLSGPDLCVASLRTVWPLRRTMGRGLIFLSLVAATAAFHVSVARPSLGISGAARRRVPRPWSRCTRRPHEQDICSRCCIEDALPAPRATAAEEEGGDPPGTSLLAYSAFGFIFASGIFCVVLNYILWGSDGY